MNTVAGAVALSAVLLLPLFIAAVVWMLRRLTGKSRYARLLMAAPLVLVVAATASLLSVARPVTGLIQRKTEQVQVAKTGLLPNVLHIFRVVVIPADVGNDTGPSTRELTLAIDASFFDQLTNGQSVMLREYHFGPLRFARLADVPAWKVLPWPEIQRFWPWDSLQDPPRGPTRTLSADVLKVRTVREALLHLWTRPRATMVFPLPQPYDEVTLRLQVPGGPEVVALDRVDTGSVPGLTVGHVLPVLVSDSRWREARLAAGTRRFAPQAWRARIRMLMPQFFGGLAVALVLALGLFN